MEGHCTFDNIIGIGVLQEYFCEDCDMALQFEQYERNFFCTQCKEVAGWQYCSREFSYLRCWVRGCSLELFIALVTDQKPWLEALKNLIANNPLEEAK